MKTFENVSKNLYTYLNHNREEKLSFVVSILYHLRTMVDKSVSVSENQSNRSNRYHWNILVTQPGISKNKMTISWSPIVSQRNQNDAKMHKIVTSLLTSAPLTRPHNTWVVSISPRCWTVYVGHVHCTADRRLEKQHRNYKVIKRLLNELKQNMRFI